MRQFLSLDTTVAVLAAAAFSLCVLAPGARAQGFESRQADMLERTGVLLDRVEGTILGELKAEENELEAQAANIVSSATGDAEREAQIRAKDRAMRDKARDLSAKIESWATGGEQLIQSLSADELNLVMSEARGIARYFGLDVEELGKLYELGKTTIKKHEFVLPDALPPDKDESYARYFADFFTFAHNREEELNTYRKEQQEYRVTLFKRVTLAYIRALLAATEPVPPCGQTMPDKILAFGNQRLRSFGCKDPVVENLRAYVQAIQKIASADADRFTAEADVVLARQALTTDLAAGLPLVGDAMDFYNLYAGEDLAGRCLTRFDYGLTAIFAAIPFLPSGWATQAVKRMGLEDHLSTFVIYMARSSEWSGEMISGVSKRFGITAEHFQYARETGQWFADILMTEISVMPNLPNGSEWVGETAKKLGLPENRLQDAWALLQKEITLPGGTTDSIVHVADGVITKPGAEKLGTELTPEAIRIRNLESAYDGQVLLRSLPPEVREELLERTRKRIADNILDTPANRLARSGDPGKVMELSNMVPEHLAEFMEEIEDLDNIAVFRYVNENSTELLRQGRGTKGMHVKGKSSDWGPQAGFIPVDQSFSKLGNPDAPRLDKIAGSSKKVKECVDAGICKQVALALENGDEVMVWKGIGGEVPVLKRGDTFLDPDTLKPIDLDPADVDPMMVLGEVHPKTGKLEPITADYDLLAVGSKIDVEAQNMHKVEGMIDGIERETKDRLNAAGKRGGYEGGDLVHHGAETNNPHTPGAFDKDPLVTVLDPELGFMNIPVCDRKCMEKWCKTTGQCGGMPLCSENSPVPPCMFVDPDRLLKDYFSDARLRGYTSLRPNAGWDWGAYNGVAGWSPKVLLETGEAQKDWIFGQYTMKVGVKEIQNRAVGFLGMFGAKTMKQTLLKATEMLFSCPGEQAQGGAQ